MISWLKNLLSGSRNVSLKTVFSIDLRSLALMRVSLALLIMLDLILRSRHMSVFYTDYGVLPRKSLTEISGMPYLSLHAAAGDLWWQIFLFLLAGLFALGLLFGYRTKLMSVLSWIMLVSLLNRNPVILQGGDILLVCMSFWAIFLPIGARWSVDAALQPQNRTSPNTQRFITDQAQLYFSVATVAVIFQVLFLYFFTALLKTGDPWRYPFEAAHYAVSLQHFATPIGSWVSQFAPITHSGTVYVLFVEAIVPLLVLLPFFWPVMRIAGLMMLASLHVAFMLMLHIGLFPLIDFMSLTVLIPSAIWIALAQRPRVAAAGVTLYFDQDCGFCLKMCLILREFLLPASVKILPAQDHPAIFEIMERENSWVVTDADNKPYIHWHAMQFLFSQPLLLKPFAWLMKLPPLMWLGNRVYHWIANNRGTMGSFTERFLPYRSMSLRPTLIGAAVAAFFLYTITIFNISMLPGQAKWRPQPIDYISRVTRIDQKWSMFAPKPLTYSMYPQVSGTLRNDATVNLYKLTNPDPNWKAPNYMYPLYDGYRWRKYIDRLRGHSNNAVRSAFGHYQCRSWNSNGRKMDEQLGILQLYYVQLDTNTSGRKKHRSRHLIWQHWCYPEFKPN